jgi:UDP-N-acetylmuramyl pentapeptide phosphotransferase/UDP-N-acetylglucosamine-1-phosphate transferase
MTSTANIMQIFLPATMTFLVGIALTPFVTHYLYKYKMWKPKGGKHALDGTPAEVFNSLHTLKEVGTPRFGGVIVWGSVLITAALLQLLWMDLPRAV